MKINISEREILNIIGDFPTLLRAEQAIKIGEKLRGIKSLILGINGMQPEKGNTCLYIVCKMQTGLTSMAENLEDSANLILSEQTFDLVKTLAKKKHPSFRHK